ncbi:MAG: hypothetical protein HS104_34035 [Polyangiaceae bacterium]|nr:hypothetical protein [Polyangiaceae bacterium]MCL4752285.1 hypothetical protein [Myxococcales bacterium]
MTNVTFVRSLAVLAAASACFACGGSYERDDRELWTVSGPPDSTHEPNAAPAPTPSRASIPRHQLGRGALVPSEGCPANQWELCEDKPAARESICVSVGADGYIDAIDEVSCSVALDMHECAPGDCPWIRCGDCLIHVDRPSDTLEDGTWRAGPPWILGSVSGGGTCDAFGGTYEVYADPTCGERTSD